MRISDWSSDVCSSDLSMVTSLPAPSAAGTRSTARVVGFLACGRRRGGPDRLWSPTGSRDSDTPTAPCARGSRRPRSEERRVGKGCVGTGRYRGTPYNIKKKKTNYEHEETNY